MSYGTANQSIAARHAAPSTRLTANSPQDAFVFDKWQHAANGAWAHPRASLPAHGRTTDIPGVVATSESATGKVLPLGRVVLPSMKSAGSASRALACSASQIEQTVALMCLEHRTQLRADVLGDVALLERRQRKVSRCQMKKHVQEPPMRRRCSSGSAHAEAR